MARGSNSVTECSGIDAYLPQRIRETLRSCQYVELFVGSGSQTRGICGKFRLGTNVRSTLLPESPQGFGSFALWCSTKPCISALSGLNGETGEPTR